MVEVHLCSESLYVLVDAEILHVLNELILIMVQHINSPASVTERTVYAFNKSSIYKIHCVCVCVCGSVCASVSSSLHAIHG